LVKEKTVPNDVILDAERAVLGALLHCPVCIGEVAALLQPEFFNRDAHQRVFRAILDLHGQGVPADAVAVANWLHHRGWLEDVRYDYLGELLAEAPTGGNLAHYARIVREGAVRRDLQAWAKEMVREAPSCPVRELLEQAQQKLRDLLRMAGGELPKGGPELLLGGQVVHEESAANE
jgi:replicative DNA helicase